MPLPCYKKASWVFSMPPVIAGKSVPRYVFFTSILFLFFISTVQESSQETTELLCEEPPH